MPSLVPVLCNVPRAQKDALGCEDSAKGKHCANHVTMHNQYDWSASMYGNIEEECMTLTANLFKRQPYDDAICCCEMLTGPAAPVIFN
jgi:hypothetical protein